MILIGDKMINAALIAWVDNDVREVKQFKPKSDKGGEGELPHVYNFSFKIGFDCIKSPDFYTREKAEELRKKLISLV